VRKFLIVVGVVLVALALAFLMSGCSRDVVTPAPTPSVSAEVEAEVPDCDLGDIVERDSDCGFTKPSPKPVVKPTPKLPAPPQPAPRKTKGW
jgi:PBP1b-binding outer membrane lipoprotein LpoB